MIRPTAERIRRGGRGAGWGWSHGEGKPGVAADLNFLVQFPPLPLINGTLACLGSDCMHIVILTCLFNNRPAADSTALKIYCDLQPGIRS